MPIWYNSTILGKDLFAKLYKEEPFTIFPSSFFNIEWLCACPAQVEHKWFESPCEDELLFLDCFSWHWHNSSKKNQIIVSDSKFDKLQKINNKKLKDIGF